MPDSLEIIGKFSDGELTAQERERIWKEIREKRDFLGKKEYERLISGIARYLEFHNPGEPYPLTRKEYVRCLERGLFEAIGVAGER